jgi:hypothetical protein
MVPERFLCDGLSLHLDGGFALQELEHFNFKLAFMFSE